MAILPTDIQILFTNYDIIAYFLNLASCSEHFISIKHRILATFNINKKNQFWQPLNYRCTYNVTPMLHFNALFFITCPDLAHTYYIGQPI
jgi:hypothetical protein